MEKTDKLTWDGLVKLEPRLALLLNEIKVTRRESRIKGLQRWQLDNLWYGKFKPAMCELVGFGVRGTLGSIKAYDIAYEKLCQALEGKNWR
jgi:hypothetical protein